MKRIFAVLGAIAALAGLTVGATSAQALVEGPYCANVLIDSGHECIHGTGHGHQQLLGSSTGVAAACVGIRAGQGTGYALNAGFYCGGNYVQVHSPTWAANGIGVFASIANPETYLSRFNGYLYAWTTYV
jgi:hypothetical protein